MIRWILPLIFVLSACGADRNAQDYNNEVFAKDYAQYKSVAGQYAGSLVTSSPDHQRSGSISIDLHPSIKEIPGADIGGTSLRVPILVGEITFYGKQPLVVSIKDSRYQVDNGTFNADIPVDLNGGSTPTSGSSATGGSANAAAPSADNSTISLNGVIEQDGTFSGHLEVKGYPEYGLIFKTKRSGILPVSADEDSIPYKAQRISQLHRYCGVQVIDNALPGLPPPAGPARQPYYVELLVASYDQSNGGILLDSLLPFHTMRVTYRLDYTNDIFIPNARWDERSQTLVGRFGTSTDISVDYSLNCNQTTTPVGPGWDCGLASNRAGQEFHVNFTPISDDAAVCQGKAPASYLSRNNS